MVLQEYFGIEIWVITNKPLGEVHGELDGGTLMNQCIHNIDLLQWMMGGEVDTVYAQCDTFLRDIDAEDFGAIVIRFKKWSYRNSRRISMCVPKNLEENFKCIC